MLLELLIFISILLIIFSLEGVFPFFPGRTDRFRHALSNLALAALGALIGGLAVSRFVTGGTAWAEC